MRADLRPENLQDEASDRIRRKRAVLEEFGFRAVARLDHVHPERGDEIGKERFRDPGAGGGFRECNEDRMVRSPFVRAVEFLLPVVEVPEPDVPSVRPLVGEVVGGPCERVDRAHVRAFVARDEQ